MPVIKQIQGGEMGTDSNLLMTQQPIILQNGNQMGLLTNPLTPGYQTPGANYQMQFAPMQIQGISNIGSGL